MRITIESTDRLIEIESRGALVPARVWEGRTARGVPVAVLVTRVAAHLDANQEEFERDLRETRRPSSQAIEAFPLRLIL